jgi:hypothetical protein
MGMAVGVLKYFFHTFDMFLSCSFGRLNNIHRNEKLGSRIENA